MSVLALCFHRNDAPAERGRITRMLEAQGSGTGNLEHIHLERRVGIGCRAFHTTPEDRGGTQPLSVPGLPYLMAWDGRIDNREELFGGLERNVDRSCSDAELMLRLIAGKGTAILPKVLGSFVFALYDRNNECITLARDAVGQRCLSYYLNDDLLIAASADSGLLCHPAMSRRLDARQFACFFSLMNLEQGNTYFKDVHKLLPGHCMTVTPEDAATRQYWSPDWNRRIRYRDDREYAEHFRLILDQAVSCRTRSVEPVGVMTSGGLDSGPIAALAASSGAGDREEAFTWTFDRYPECNEIDYVSRLCEMWGMTLNEVNCDDCAPYRDLDLWPVHPDTPDQDPYRLFLDNTYRAASDKGVRVLLNGSGGDNLYLSGPDWFTGLLKRGRFGPAFDAALWYCGLHGPARFLRRVLIRGLLPRPLLERLRPPSLPDWLTEDARALLPSPESRWPRGHPRAPRPAQALGCLSLRIGEFLAAESRWSRAAGIEVRYPMRDRRLIEFALALPDEQLRFKDNTRPILRRAAAGLLPSRQLDRAGKTSFESVFDSGRQDAAPMIEALLEDPGGIWRRFLRNNRRPDGLPAIQNFGKALEWQAVSTELWRRHLHLNF